MLNHRETHSGTSPLFAHGPALPSTLSPACNLQGKFNLETKPGAIGKELKWGVGTVTLQFKLAEKVNYMEEAQKKAFGRTRQKYIHDKIRAAREDFAV